MLWLKILVGYLMDLVIGDPRYIPHPVIGIGKMISFIESKLRRCFPDSRRGELVAGAVLAILICIGSFLVPWTILYGLNNIDPLLGFLGECVMCFQILAVKSLRTETMKVYRCLSEGDLTKAREAVSMVVGRDTERLSEAGVAKAAVETIAENTSDGIIAPLFFMAIGGAPLGFLYKAINTMDSMIGYKNDRYRNFGTFAARLDDVVNFIPSRLSAILLFLASYFLRLDWKNGIRIFLRDRKNHASPNSGQTESVCAGVLDVQLAGDAWYFGHLVKKKTIGDEIRSIEAEDIRRTNHLMYVTAILGVFLACGINFLLGR
ncbi:MAG: cobalamin biosynthesis protein CobD [Clostridiales bacterium]|nr:cobalamin biosynthesis protein CobD [Clostridiales bacterium]